MASLAVLITYCGEKELLGGCVKSLLEQEEAPDEILVHDDASTHPARDYLPADPRIHVLRAEKNLGPSTGRNRLLAESRADYVHFHDADDRFHPDWCRVVRDALAADPKLDAFFTEVASFVNGVPHRDRVVGLDALTSTEPDLVRFCLFHAMLVPCGTYRRSLLTRLGGYRNELWQSEDYEFHCRLALASPRFAVDTRPLVHIAIRPESRSQKQGEVWSCRLQALRLMFLDLPPRYHPDVAEAALHVGSKLFHLGDRSRAREAFRLAVELGPPRYGNRMFVYRQLARWLGPEAAEWMGYLYRRCLPGNMRGWVRRKTG